MLRGFIEKVLKNYLRARKENYIGHKLAKLIRTDFPNFLVEITENNDSYIFKGSAGQGAWAKCPWVAILDKNVTSSVQSGYFPVYLFREDMQGVYLSLMFGTTEFIQKYGEKAKNELRLQVSQFRNQHSHLLESFKELDIDLASDSSNSIASFYEVGSIAAKYYDLKKLPSEEELQSDYWHMIDIYNELTGTKKDLRIIEDKNEVFDALEKFQNIIKNNTIPVPNSSKNLYFSPKWDFWISIGKNPNSSYNLFGVGNPISNDINNTIVEINFPFSGINRNISGAFLTDDSGKIYLAHRGRLGGLIGGKTLLEENYEGDWVDVTDGGNINKLILIGGLDEIDFLEKLKNFVFEICKIKRGEDCLKYENFFDFIRQKGYFFDKALIENFLLSLKVKPFVILTGNSGTGKTKLAQLFAQYLDQNNGQHSFKEIYNEILSFKRTITSYSRKHGGGWRLKPNEVETLLNSFNVNEIKELPGNLNLEIYQQEQKVKGISYLKEVKQSYSDIPQIYLYYDEDVPFYDKLSEMNGELEIHILKKDYEPIYAQRYEIVPVGANWTENRHIIGFFNVITENYNKTRALDLILSAEKDTHEPYILILDEMNLSHVERYFSDFLSAMESNEAIELHQGNSEHLEDIHLPPEKILLPPNLMVVGTVNIDETTYMFSPKVLDRANTLEFLTQSAEHYMSGSPDYTITGDFDYLQNPLSDIIIREENINQLKNRLNGVKTDKGQFIWDVLSKNITEFQNILKEGDFDFGFRTINEIVRFMCVAWQYEKKPIEWTNWERYFDAQIMQKMLPKLHGSQKELATILIGLENRCKSGEFQSSAEKIMKMRKTLQDKKYVSFTG